MSVFRSSPLRPVLFRRCALALLASAMLGASGCGGGDDCSGFISVNASPAECQRLAQQFGCSSFDVEGPSCGLLSCASCGGLDDEDEGS